MKLKVITEFHKGDDSFKVGQIIDVDQKLADRYAVERLAVPYDPKAEAKEEKGSKDDK